MMNDETHAFERRLKQQPLREIPADWRSQILAAAQPHAPRPAPRASFWSTFNLQPSTFNLLLWPHPKAWAGLAAVWVLIIGLNLSQRDPAPRPGEKTSAPPVATLLALRQQQQLLAELSGSPEAAEADRPRSYVPKPHSEWLELRVL